MAEPRRVAVLRMSNDGIWELRSQQPLLQGELLNKVNSLVQAIGSFRMFDRPQPPRITVEEVVLLRERFRIRLEEWIFVGEGKPEALARKDALKDTGIHKGQADVEDGCGEVAGVPVGTSFRYALEMNLVGVHSQPFKGISYFRCNGVPVATSVTSLSEHYNDIQTETKLKYDGLEPSDAHPDALEHTSNLALMNAMLWAPPSTNLFIQNIPGTSRLVIHLSPKPLERLKVRVIAKVPDGAGYVYVYRGLKSVYAMMYNDEKKLRFLLE